MATDEKKFGKEGKQKPHSSDIELLTKFFVRKAESDVEKPTDMQGDQPGAKPQDWCEPDGWTSCHPTCYPSVCSPSDSCGPHKNGNLSEKDTEIPALQIPTDCLPQCFPSPCSPDTNCYPVSQCIPKHQMSEEQDSGIEDSKEAEPIVPKP